ncbi:MAG TPA: ATP-binding protein [Anaerolineae bacterium]
MLSRLRRARPTLGFLTAWITDGYASSAWSGVMDVAREQNVNVVHFVGARLRTPLASEAPAGVIFDLPNPANVDGLIICAEMLYHFVDPAELNRFVSRYRPLPMTSIGFLQDIPSVIPDIQEGVQAMMQHLVTVHGYRRLVFLRGPAGEETAEAGLSGYRQALGKHHIPYREDLVTPAAEHWGKEASRVTMSALFDERGLRPGRDFDAVVGLGDNETLGAIETLHERGYDVPTDVGVTGLNNIESARFMPPSLTTVDRQISEVARRATSMLLDSMAGREVPRRVVVQPTVVVRRSCGCMPETVLAAASPAAPAPATVNSAAPRSAQEAMALAVGRAGRPSTVGLVPNLPLDWSQRLVASFFAALDGGEDGRFVAYLEALLELVMVADEDPSAWHGVLSELRRQARPALAGTRLQKAEDLWQQARALIGDFAERRQGLQKLESGEQVAALSHITQSLISTFDATSLMDTLAGELPRLGIRSGYLALYEDPAAPMRRARLILAYDSGGRTPLDAAGRTYATAELVRLAMDKERRLDMVVLPLYFREEQQGLLMLEMGPRDGSVYDSLKVQIASALRGAALVRRNAELYDDAVHARRVAEEADQLKSRFLATVSHELRTPLSLIVGTIDMLLQGDAGGKERVPEPLREDLDRVHRSAQHLARLISDVLDLASSQAGQLRLTCQPLDLARLLRQVAVIGEPLVREKGLHWHAEIPDRLPHVWADPTRLQQVVLNLITNAVKFTEQGEVRLEAAADGDAVVVSISDSGVGIPVAEQAAIFDEFQQSERTAGRGYGGMGLGLAICRRLIEMHGGRIGARSSGLEGSGSTFYFTLPAIDQTDQTAPDDREAEQRQEVVLLLTEVTEGCDALRCHLESRGFLVEVLSVAERPDWLANIIAAPPGAVVLDFEPAAERGWEVMQLIKQSPSLQDMPVLFYALSDQEDKGSLLELDYLTKPVAGADLVRALARQGVDGSAGERGRTVLIVDDETCILDMHTRIIQARLPGCQILKASNGRAALELMANEVIDLVLLDLMMPEVDGFEVLEAMQTRETMRGIPVIVVTAQILTETDMIRLQRGVAAVLAKGLFTSAEVLTEIEGALARSKRLGSEAQRVARRVMAYIHEHYAEDITREDLARFVALSERHLNRCFHQETGLGPMEYLNRYRVKQARVLLETSAATITDVALAVGFSESSYFGRVFRAETGLTPAAYRRSR